jgi:hypothetical protein
MVNVAMIAWSEPIAGEITGTVTDGSVLTFRTTSARTGIRLDSPDTGASSRIARPDLRGAGHGRYRRGAP